MAAVTFGYFSGLATSQVEDRDRAYDLLPIYNHLLSHDQSPGLRSTPEQEEEVCGMWSNALGIPK